MRAAARPGFALLLVLILVGVGVVLGVSLLSVASLRVNISDNHRSLARARYLAESGLEHGLGLLRTYPEQFDGSSASPLGPFHADGSADAYFISGVENTGRPGEYTLTATGTVGNVRRTSSMTVTRSLVPLAEVKPSILVGSGLTWLPSSLTIRGDVHANGDIINAAVIQGNVSATGSVQDPWGRVTGEIDNLVGAMELPNLRVADYLQYQLGGVEYQAVEFTKDEFEKDEPLAGGGAVTVTNVGGVVYLNPLVGSTVRLKGELNFTGTLVIVGDLELNGGNITLTAVKGFPAIVATGKILVRNNGTNVTINGMVVAGLGIVPGETRTDASSTTVNGAVVSNVVGYDSALEGTHVVNYDQQRAWVYDFSQPVVEGEYPQVTVKDWHD